MTDAQKAALAAVAAKKELRALALKEDSSAEAIEAKTKEVDDLEARAAALSSSSEEEVEPVKSEPTKVDAETRERRELRSKARVSEFLSAALTGRPVGGASAEYADAVGVPGSMPLDLLDSLEPVEERAVTPGPADETVSTTRPTVPHAFARTDAAALGIAMPMVAAGEAHYPALGTAPPAGPKAEDAAAAQTAAAFTLTKREPKRITGQFLIRLEDLALMPSMESDLRRGIASAMADSLDSQVIGGSGAGANLDGLFNQATDVNIAGATETFGTAIGPVCRDRGREARQRVRRHSGAARRGCVQALRGDLRERRQGRRFRLGSLDGEARRAQGFDPSSGQGQQRPEGYSRPGRATSSDHRSHLEGCGADRRSLHASREGPAGRDGRLPGREPVRALRDRSGDRGPPEAQLNPAWSGAAGVSCGREAVGPLGNGREPGSRRASAPE